MGEKRVLIPLDGEIFREVDDTDGKYWVSNLGRVYNSVTEHEVKQSIKDRKIHGANGYRVVHLYLNGVQKTVPVHRLVATAFVENPHPDTWNTVNHIDEDKTNNKANNLEWCDMSYQNEHATHNKRVIESNTRIFRYTPMIVEPQGIKCKSRSAAWKVYQRLRKECKDARIKYDIEALKVPMRDVYGVAISNDHGMRLFTADDPQKALDAFFNGVNTLRTELEKLGLKYKESRGDGGILEYKAVAGKVEYTVRLA